jgi:tetratricopeptide (TPR) repeat protein
VLEVVDVAVPEFERAGDEFGLFLCAFTRGQGEHMFGAEDAAMALFDQAHEHARRTGFPHIEEKLVGWRIASRKDGNTPAPEFLAWLETLPAHAQSNFVYIAFQAEGMAMCGQVEEAQEQLRRLCADLEDQGASLPLGIILGLCRAETELFLGDPQAALDFGLRGCELLERIGEEGWRSTASTQVAESYYRLDRLDEADSWAERASGLGEAEDAVTQMGWRLVRAKVLARRGALDQAEAVMGEAMAIAARIDLPLFRANAQADLAEVLALAGRPAEAREALAVALELARAKGNLPLADRLEAMLASG